MIQGGGKVPIFLPLLLSKKASRSNRTFAREIDKESGNANAIDLLLDYAARFPITKDLGYDYVRNLAERNRVRRAGLARVTTTRLSGSFSVCRRRDMKNALWAFGTSVSGSIVASYWVLNGPKINISSDIWIMTSWALTGVFIFLFVLFLFLPRMVRGFVRWRKDMERAARDEDLEHF